MSKLVKSIFFIEHLVDNIEGLENPNKHWNGWAMPFFTVKNIKKIQEAIENDIVNTSSFRIDGEIVYYKDDNLDEEIILEPTEYKGELYYDCSLGWTWEKSSERQAS